MNQPIREWLRVVTPERQRRFDEERAQYPVYEEAFRRMRADQRVRDKMVYAYIGGSGKKLNQEIIGPTFVHRILECNFRIALERYIFEVSSEQKSQDALQLFVEGIADWDDKEPTVREQMILTFGLFSMPPGGINKLPNVDYHVWMDQQMNVVANHPVMAGMAGLNWWTSLQADEETVRFVGKLYRHYAIEGKTGMLTSDPLFMTHIQNADFEKGTDGLDAASGRGGHDRSQELSPVRPDRRALHGPGPPGRSGTHRRHVSVDEAQRQGPNRFSQTIKDLEPGRLYSMKMFSCDYQDLVHPQKKTVGRGATSLSAASSSKAWTSTRNARSRKCIPRRPSRRFRSGSPITGRSSGPGHDGQADCLRLARRRFARRPDGPGADVQLSGDRAVPRVTSPGRVLDPPAWGLPKLLC